MMKKPLKRIDALNMLYTRTNQAKILNINPSTLSYAVSNETPALEKYINSLTEYALKDLKKVKQKRLIKWRQSMIDLLQQ